MSSFNKLLDAVLEESRRIEKLLGFDHRVLKQFANPILELPGLDFLSVSRKSALDLSTTMAQERAREMFLSRNALAEQFLSIDRAIEMQKALAWSTPPQAAINSQNAIPVALESTWKQIEEATHAFHTRFQMPDMRQFLMIQEQIEASIGRFGEMGLRSRDVQDAMARMVSPWVDPLQIDQSLAGITTLVGIGKVIRSNPFGVPTRQALDEALGTWTALPPGAIEDSLQRESFYLSSGLAKNLLLPPEPAFTQSIEVARIFLPRSNSLPVAPESDEAPELSLEEEAVLTRQQRAYYLVTKFENALRKYLHRAMTQRYGDKWEKSRTPENGKTSERWIEKRDAAVKKGETSLELIHYADFTDYSLLITRRDNWKEVFSEIFRDENELRVSFRRIEAIRVITMHGRPLSKSDLLMLSVETTHLLAAIGALRRR